MSIFHTSTGPLPWLPDVPSRLREHPEWGSYLDARARLVADLADTIHHQALTATRTPAWLASCLAQPTGQTIADLSVWRAAMNVPDADARPTGERQLAKAAARWQRHLDCRVAGDRQPALAEWGPLLHHLEPRLAGDDFTPTLAARLAQLSASGLNARGLLHTAASSGHATSATASIAPSRASSAPTACPRTAWCTAMAPKMIAGATSGSTISITNSAAPRKPPASAAATPVISTSTAVPSANDAISTASGAI